MVTHGEPGRAGAPELLALFDGVARLHPGAREVAVERLQTEPVVDDDGVAVDRQRAREGDHALVRGGHRALSERSEVVAKMHLPVDLPASVEVGARLGEVREDLRVAGLDEDAIPQRVGRRPEGGAPLLLLGLPAEVAVDQEEAVEQRLRGRALRQELRDLGLEEVLREADPVAAKVPGPNLGRDAARRGVARPSRRPSVAPWIVTGVSSRLPADVGCVSTTAPPPPCAMRTSACAIRPRAASSTTVNVVDKPMKRGGGMTTARTGGAA